MAEYTHIIEKVPSKYLTGMPSDGTELWYYHRKGYDYIPVIGSIGTKKNAAAICRTYNLDGKVHYK